MEEKDKKDFFCYRRCTEYVVLTFLVAINRRKIERKKDVFFTDL